MHLPFRYPVRLHDIPFRCLRHRDDRIRTVEEFAWAHESVQEPLLRCEAISEMFEGEIVDDQYERNVWWELGEEVGVGDEKGIHPRETPHVEPQTPYAIEELVRDPADDPSNVWRIERREVATRIHKSICEEEVLIHVIGCEERSNHSFCQDADTPARRGSLETAEIDEDAHNSLERGFTGAFEAKR